MDTSTRTAIASHEYLSDRSQSCPSFFNFHSSSPINPMADKKTPQPANAVSDFVLGGTLTFSCTQL